MNDTDQSSPTERASPDATRGQHLRMASGAGVSLLGKGLGRFIQLLSQIVLARVLGPTEFGQFALGQTVMRLLGGLAPFGLPRAAVVFGAKYVRRDSARFRGVVWQCLGATAAVGAFCTLLLLSGSRLLSVHVFNDKVPVFVLVVLGVAVPFVALLRVSVELTRVSQRLHFGVIAEDVAQPAAVLIAFGLLFSFFDPLMAATLALTISFVVGTALAVRFLRQIYPGVLQFNQERVGCGDELRKFCASAGLAMVFSAVAGSAVGLLVGRYAIPADMAKYQAAKQIPFVFGMILPSFSAIFAPMAARFVAEGNIPELRTLFHSSTRWGMYLALPLYLVILLSPARILGASFGISYEQAALTLVVLATAQLVNVGTGSVGLLLLTAGGERAWLALSGGAALATVGFGFVLVPKFGIVGGAFTVLIATIIQFGGGVLVARFRLGLWPYARRSIRLALPTTAALLLGIWIERSILGPPVIELIAVAVTVAVAFYGVLFLVGLEEDDIHLYHQFRARFSSSVDSVAGR